MAFLDEIRVKELWDFILKKLYKKVDKVEGKGLSTNDFTTEEKNKLDATSIFTIAEKNKLNDIYTKAELDDLLAGGGGNFTYGTEDLVAGETELAEGEVYLVYE